MKVKLYSDGEFIGTADGIGADTGVIVYMDRYFTFQGTHFEQVNAQRIHAIEYAPPRSLENQLPLPTGGCNHCEWSTNEADSEKRNLLLFRHLQNEHGIIDGGL